VTRLIGHDHAVNALREAVESGRLHHAWLLAGPKGVGKGMFAEMAARWLLAQAAGPAWPQEGLSVPDNHPASMLYSAGSHPDFRRLARLVDEKTGRTARSITVDQVRSLQGLFATTGSYSDRRVVIIDAVDDLERSAANALLKNLEEPPAGSIFFLISHSPGRLLPTIRSRCRVIRFHPLDEPAMRQALGAALPDRDSVEIDELVEIGDGAPGQALSFAGLGISQLDRSIDQLIRSGDPTNADRVALSRALSLQAAQPRYEAFLTRVPIRIAAYARTRSGDALKQALQAWGEAQSLASSALAHSLDPQTTIFQLCSLLADLAGKAGSAKARP